MGTVYLAVRTDEAFQKRVAIKILKRDMDSDTIVRRFRNERQILASLQHPCIAALLDGGSTPEGLPYFAMEYVEGQRIVEYCDDRLLDTSARLELFRKVCAAVQHAHQNLIIHRDIKPANVLVTNDGTPKLLDFGIAKLLNPDLPAETIAPTFAGPQLMTPSTRVLNRCAASRSPRQPTSILWVSCSTSFSPDGGRTSCQAALRRTSRVSSARPCRCRRARR